MQETHDHVVVILSKGGTDDFRAYTTGMGMRRKNIYMSKSSRKTRSATKSASCRSVWCGGVRCERRCGVWCNVEGGFSALRRALVMSE